MGDGSERRKPKPRGVEDLEVFGLSHEMVLEVYRVTKLFPHDERYGLVAQMRRSASSIPMNLTEGRARMGKDEFRHFVSIARGSAAELQYQLRLATDLGYLIGDTSVDLKSRCERILRMLSGLYSALSNSRRPTA